MINYRVMGNQLKHGTFCVEDRIPSHAEAVQKLIELRSRAQQSNANVHYFVQEYEECRHD